MTGSSTSQYIKERNLNHIDNIIKREKAISRVEIARKINLSQTAVGRLVADLIGAGYVREGTNVGNSVGRQRVQLHLVHGWHDLDALAEVGEDVGIEVGDANGAELARLIGVGHGAPGGKVVVASLMLKVQVKIADVQALERGVNAGRRSLLV